MKNKQFVLITGVAGFIGYSLAKNLLDNKTNIIGIDSINNYYDIKIKKKRLQILKKYKSFVFIKNDLQNLNKITFNLENYKIKKIFHAAAQAGVRHSIKKPEDYVKNNLIGFFNILEISRKYKVKHLIFCSTSGVYGLVKKKSLDETMQISKPIQFYAATKSSNEIMAYSYSHLYKIPVSIVRLFTVYGPWGRPDMALFIFTKQILNNKKINLFNYGNHYRSFSYIDDIVRGLKAISNHPPKSKIPYNNYNLGSGENIKLTEMIKILEKLLNKKAKIKYKKLQVGDIKSSIANISKLKKKFNFKPKVSFEEGIKKFVDWYKNFYKII